MNAFAGAGVSFPSDDCGQYCFGFAFGDAMSGPAIKAFMSRVAELPTPGCKIVLFDLMVRHEQGDAVEITAARMSRSLGIRRHTIGEALDELAARGFILRRGKVAILNFSPPPAPETVDRSVDMPVDMSGITRIGPDSEWTLSDHKMDGERPPFKEEKKRKVVSRRIARKPRKPRLSLIGGSDFGEGQ